MATRSWLAYEEAGGARAVVLLHGHPFNRTMWQAQMRPLGEGHRVIAPDLRGYGHSPATPGTVTMAELATDVWGLLDDLGVATAAPVGLSMGGLVAMEMALARPDRIWALGLVASTAEPASADERRTRLALADRVEAVGMEALVESMVPRLFGPSPGPEIVERVTAMIRATNPVGAAAALRGRAQRPDYRPALRDLTVPAFVCTGTRDQYSTAQITEELVGCLHDPTAVSLPEVGHLPNLEATEAFNTALLEFLAGAVRSTPD